MLLDQPLARPTEIHVGTVEQQFHGSPPREADTAGNRTTLARRLMVEW